MLGAQARRTTSISHGPDQADLGPISHESSADLGRDVAQERLLQPRDAAAPHQLEPAVVGHIQCLLHAGDAGAPQRSGSIPRLAPLGQPTGHTASSKPRTPLGVAVLRACASVPYHIPLSTVNVLLLYPYCIVLCPVGSCPRSTVRRVRDVCGSTTLYSGGNHPPLSVSWRSLVYDIVRHAHTPQQNAEVCR